MKTVNYAAGGGEGSGGGVGGDWVDETALRTAMGRAYETFLLLHGPVNAALDGPVAPVVVGSQNGAENVADNDAGNDAGNVAENDAGNVAENVAENVAIPGREVLRRLAVARKRLRKAKMEADEVC